MKTYVKLTVLFALFLAGCSSAYQTAGVHDDIYYSRNNAEIAAEDAHQASAAVVQVNPANESKPAGNYQEPYEQDYQQEEYAYYDEPVETETYYDDEGNTYVTQNFYMDSYYDYSYSSRIRRFHRDWASFGYYDPYFTNMYWYNYNPHYYGTSIYMGYNSLFFPSFYYSWGYRPWGWTHYGYGWGYGNPWGNYWGGHTYGYMGGYHDGYWSGYYMGAYGYPYGGNYYYDYEPTGISYGARRPSGSSSGVGVREAGRYGSAGTKLSVSESGRIQGREPAGAQPSDTKDARTTAGETRESSSMRPKAGEAASPGQIAQRPAVESKEQSGEQRRPTQYEPRRRPQDYTAPTTSQQREGQTPRYTRPVQPQERSGQTAQPGERPRTYTSPSQQQPRSNQEYRRPSTEQRPAATGRDGQVAPLIRPQNQPTRPQATPQQRPVQTRPQATPQRTPSQNRPQAAPQRTPQNRPQAAPQRPSNNNRPQAAPSRSPQRSTPSNVRTSPSRGSSGSSGVRSSSPSRSSGSSSRSSSSGSSSRRR